MSLKNLSNNQLKMKSLLIPGISRRTIQGFFLGPGKLSSLPPSTISPPIITGLFCMKPQKLKSDSGSRADFYEFFKEEGKVFFLFFTEF